VVFGAALVIVHNARVDRARLESKLDELVDAIGNGGGNSSTSGGMVTPSSAAGIFAAGGSSYHRPDCRLVTGRNDIAYVTGAEVVSRDLTACRVCRPNAVESLSN
jgi:hypothetical protein